MRTESPVNPVVYNSNRSILDFPLYDYMYRGVDCLTNVRLIYLGGVYWRELGASRLFDEIAIRPTRRYYLMGLGLDRARFDVTLIW
jgi:hypothetical protein